MQTLLPFKAQIKADLKKQFIDIKNSVGNERLYVFALGRVEDISGQYFAMGHTLEKMAQQLSQKPSTHYSDFWWIAELSYGSDYGSIRYEDLEPFINNTDDAIEDALRIEYDSMLIESLIELKNEGLFDQEIPEFSVYIQYQDEAFLLEEESFAQIFPEKDSKAFASKYKKTAASLTSQLIAQYALVSD